MLPTTHTSPYSFSWIGFTSLLAQLKKRRNIHPREMNIINLSSPKYKLRSYYYSSQSKMTNFCSRSSYKYNLCKKLRMINRCLYVLPLIHLWVGYEDKYQKMQCWCCKHSSCACRYDEVAHWVYPTQMLWFRDTPSANSTLQYTENGPSDLCMSCRRKVITSDRIVLKLTRTL